MPIRRGMGGLSSGAGGNLFDRPGFFDNAEIVNLTVDTKMLLKAASETYGIEITHADTSGASQDYALEIPALAANAEIVTTNHAQTLTNKTITDLRLPAIYDSNGNELFKFTATSSAVNEITLANAATGNPPVFSSTGGDTNIDIKLQPKGSGKVHITGGLQVDGTTTTIDSTTLSVDDKNIEMGSVASPSDSTADGGGITLKGATDKTIIWDNTNDNWTSNQDWNIASGKSFKINNAVTLNATTLGSAVVTSSLTTTGTLNSGAISSGFGNVDIGTSVLTAGQLNIDNIRIDGNTISSTSGQILFDATTTLDFGDDSVLNIGTLTIDAIHGDNNAIQVGDNSDDAVSIYRVNALTAIGDLDIGAHDLRAATITPDGLTAGQVVYTGTAGVLSAEAGFEYNATSNTLTVNTVAPTTINAFTLGGKLTAGSSEIEGSAFDINGGTVDAITSLTVANNVDVGNYKVTAKVFEASDLSAGHIVYASTNGLMATDSSALQWDDSNNILTATNIGAFTAVGAIDFDSEQMTNVNIDSGAIDGANLGASSAVTLSAATIGGGLTWGAAQNFGSYALTNVNIDSGTVNLITSFGIKQAATAYEMQIATGATTLTANRVVTIDPNNAARTLEISGDLTFGNAFTTGGHALTLTTSGTTNVTLPTTGTLATIAGNETLTNKVLTTPVIATIVNNSNNLTLPTTADTIVGRATTDTLTNKTISGSSNTLSNIGNSSLSNSSITVSDGSNTTAIALGGTATFAAGEGLDVAESSGTVTFSGEDATTSNKGVASFHGDNFAVSSGAVTIKDGGVANAELANSTITMAASAGSNDAIALGETFTITAGEGIDTTMGTNLVTIAGEDATTSNKGIASFHSDNFAVSSGAVTIKDAGVANAELANSAITIGGTSTSLGGTITALTALTDLDLTAGNKTIFDTVGANTLTIGASGTTVAIAGDLSVAGTTTTVNSTTVTIADPIFNLGGTSAPSSDDNKDRGISFRWHNGSAAKQGFFGYDDSAGKMTFIPDASISSEVVSGSAGTIVADLEGDVTGDVTGNADTATTATNITASANNSTNETVYLTFVDGATGTQGIETDTGLSYNPSTGVVTAGEFSGTVTGTAEYATRLANARTIGGVSFDGTANIVPNTITVADTTDTTSFVALFESATGDLAPKTDAGITYNAGTAALTATTFVGALTGNVTGNVSGSAGSATGNAATATALATGRTIGMTGDVVWTSPSFDGSGNVTAAATIQANAVHFGMLHNDVIGGLSALGSGAVATGEDYLMVWDETDDALKKVLVSNLGVSGTAAGSGNEIQYNNSNEFAGASNVEIKSNSLALKEQSAPSNVSGYGMLYAGTNNELYYKDDGGNATKITNAGSLSGGGAFRGVKMYLNDATIAISNNSATTLGDQSSTGTWTESYDVGGFHSTSSNQTRITFGQVGYYEIKIQQEWQADAAGYREIRATHVDTSNSNTANVILRDRMDGSSQANISGSSTTFYADDAADYVTIQAYQNSGAAVNIVGNNDDSTFVSVTRLDVATQASNSSGASGRIQFSDGSGGFSSDSDLTFSTDTLTATKIGAFEAAGAIDFSDEAMTNVNIDSGDIASGVTINKSPTVTLTGDVTASATAMTNLGNVSLATTVASGAVHAGMLNTDVIASQGTEITSGIADADEMLYSDAGTLKKVGLDTLKTYFGSNVGSTSIVTVGDLDAGSITSNFGTINTGASAITTTGLISGGSLDIDDVLINGSTIGHTDDTDLITVDNGLVTVAGEISVTTLDIGGTNVAATAAELNIMDGNTSASSTTLADADRIVVNDAGTMKQVALTDFETYFESVLDTLSAVTTVGALNAGSITSGFTSIDVGSGAISTTGTATTGALVVGGDISTAAAQDWDLVDNNASALSFDASGKSGILEIVTTNGSEKVAMSGDLTVAGNMTVTGTTTQVNTVTMNAQNAVIFEGATADNYETTLTIVDPTADHSVYMPNQSGYLPVLAAASTTQVSSTPAELNLLDGSSANTVVNSKAVIYGSGGELAGTLSTAAQGSVTSLGTLTALTGGTGDLIWDTDTFVVDSSADAVGIGTTAPAAPLHVSDAYSGTPTDGIDGNVTALISDTSNWMHLQLLSSTSTGSTIRFGDTSNTDDGVIAYDQGTNSMQFKTNGNTTARMTIDSAGDVGIGTTTPTDQLEIAKSAANATTTLATYSTTDGHQSRLMFTKSANATVGTLAATADDEGLGYIQWSSVDNQGTPAIAQSAYIIAKQDAASSARPAARLEFATSDGTNIATRMTIDKTGLVTFASGFAVGSDAAGDILYHNGTSYVRLPKGTADQVLTMNDGATAPGWENASGGGAALANDGDNRVTTATGSGGINGEANLTFDGTTLGLTGGFVQTGGTRVNTGSTQYINKLSIPGTYHEPVLVLNTASNRSAFIAFMEDGVRKAFIGGRGNVTGNDDQSMAYYTEASGHQTFYTGGAYTNDTASLHLDDATTNVTVGSGDGTGAGLSDRQFNIVGAPNGEANISIECHTSAASTTPGFRTYRSRGTKASPTAVDSGDRLSQWYSYGRDDGDYREATYIQSIAEADGDANGVSAYFEFGSAGQADPAQNTTSTALDMKLGGRKHQLLWAEAANSAITDQPQTLQLVRNGGPVLWIKRGSSNGEMVYFANSSNTLVGNITSGSSSTSYNTSSDYRQKENIVPLTGATARLTQLKPKRFNFIGDGETVDGFLAHELQEVVPQGVTGTKDETEVNEDGETVPKYQSIDRSNIVPLLTAALQEALARIDILESEVKALKE